MSGSVDTPGTVTRLSIPVCLARTDNDSPLALLAALVDSAAVVNLMDVTLARQLGITTTPGISPQAVQAPPGVLKLGVHHSAPLHDHPGWPPRENQLLANYYPVHSPS